MNQTNVIDSICSALQTAWRRGERLSLEQVLESETSRQPSDLSTETVVRLIQTEVGLRRQHGQPVNVEDYRSRFPWVPVEILDDLIAFPDIPSDSKNETPLLPSRYQIRHKIGQGGAGQVWSVVDSRMNRVVAIKVTNQWLRLDAATNQRLEREAKLTGSLQHPGVPPIYDQGKLHDGSQFFAMKLVDGKTLAQILDDEESRLDQAQLINVFQQVCQTIAFAHSRHVIHRDLKPQNVMVGSLGEVQVMDWGMSRRIDDGPTSEDLSEYPPANKQRPAAGDDSIPVGNDVSMPDPLRSLTQAGEVFGTPAYMAPEQARGEIDLIGPASDVYGLGAIMFEILTGTLLYEGGSGKEILKRAAIGDLEDFSERLARSSAPVELSQLCQDCLQPDADQRPANAEQVYRRLADYQLDVQKQLEQAKLDQHAAEVLIAEEQKRRKLATRASAAVVAAVLLGLIGVVWQWNESLQAKQAAVESAELAQKRLQQAKQTVKDYLLEVSESRSLLASSSGTQNLRRSLLQKAREYFEDYVENSPDDPALKDDLADAYYHLGLVSMELDSGVEPVEFFLEAYDLSGELVHSGEVADETHYRLIDSANHIAIVLNRVGQLRESLDWSRRTMDTTAARLIEQPESRQLRLRRANAIGQLAVTQRELGEDDQAEASLAKALSEIDELVAMKGPADSVGAAIVLKQVSLLRQLGSNRLQDKMDYDAAVKYLSRARQILLSLDESVRYHEMQFQINECANDLCEAYWHSGQTELAKETLRESITAMEPFVEKNPLVLNYRLSLVSTINFLSYCLESEGDEETLKCVAQSKSLLASALEKHPESLSVLSRYAYALKRESDYYHRRKEDHAAALSARTKSLDTHQKMRELSPDDRAIAVAIVQDYQSIGLMQDHLGEAQKAERAYLDAIALIDELKAAGIADRETMHAQAGVLNNLGLLRRKANRLDEALKSYRQAAGLYRELAGDDPVVSPYFLCGSTLSNIALVMQVQGKSKEALKEFDNAIEMLRKARKARPKDATIRLFLFDNLISRSDVRFMLKEFELARDDLEEAIGMNDNFMQKVAILKLGMLKSYLGVDLAGNVKTTVELVRKMGESAPGDFWVQAALVPAQAAVTIDKDGMLDDEQKQARVKEYLDITVDLLNKALDRRKSLRIYRPPAMSTMTPLDSLWKRAELKEIVERVENGK